MFKIYRLWTLLPEADPLPPGSDSPSPGVGTWWFVLHTTCSRSKSTPAGTVGRSEHRCCPSHSQFLGYEMFKHPRLQGTEYILRLDQASVEEEALTPPGVCSHRAEGAPPNPCSPSVGAREPGLDDDITLDHPAEVDLFRDMRRQNVTVAHGGLLGGVGGNSGGNAGNPLQCCQWHTGESC